MPSAISVMRHRMVHRPRCRGAIAASDPGSGAAPGGHPGFDLHRQISRQMPRIDPGARFRPAGWRRQGMRDRQRARGRYQRPLATGDDLGAGPEHPHLPRLPPPASRNAAGMPASPGCANRFSSPVPDPTPAAVMRSPLGRGDPGSSRRRPAPNISGRAMPRAMHGRGGQHPWGQDLRHGAFISPEARRR